MAKSVNKARRFGTAPVFFTSIATILGAILFLRFGWATGTLGFWGVIMVIIVSHMVTIPAALSLSEIATNQKVEGGGVYYIISRSFGLNIGATIGITLYFAQAISVAFYVIAFTEAFEPLFTHIHSRYNIMPPRQLISVPVMLILSYVILKKGANLGVKSLYFVVAILFFTLVLFFTGSPDYADPNRMINYTLRNQDDFFTVLAIIFPAFTGIAVGVGLSGDLKNPGKSIPIGILSATVTGMMVYFFVTWKLASSASPGELINNQLIMSDIAVWGKLVVPLGLAASTISSAIGSVLVAPRTLQALGVDRSLPTRGLNYIFSRGRTETNEPYNATLITCVIATVFVVMGGLDMVAQIITMFFLISYSSLCFISFLSQFGSDPSYRPTFKSKWYISLGGFLISIWLMLMINLTAAISSIIILTIIYFSITNQNKERRGLEVIFQGAIFQLARKIHVFLQKAEKKKGKSWRPAVVCISKNTFERTKPFELITWISHKYGFATYIHLIEGYFSKATSMQSDEKLQELIKLSHLEGSNVYVDTLISPSYTSAIAQVIQLPGISGMENNMALFEFDQGNIEELHQIIDNYSLVRAGDFDICIFANSPKAIRFRHGIHVWIKPSDSENANLMILISYIILGHPDWKNSFIKIFSICHKDEEAATWSKFAELIHEGRLPISMHNVEVITQDEEINPKKLINEKSAGAGLTLIGFRPEVIKQLGESFFTGYDIGDIVFVNSNIQKEIN